MSHYFSARDKYKPNKIRILLIAESPPASGGYFYFETATGRGELFVETMKALRMIPEDKGLPRGSDKRPLLEAFRDGGFFVLDASYEPVNNKKPAERKLAIKRELPQLVSDVKKLDPSSIIIVKCSLYKLVREALEKAGLGGRILNKEQLPFPSHGHQKIYRTKLRNLVAVERKSQSALKQKEKPCLVACSVLRKEIEQLIRRGDLGVECVYVSKYFHVDYAQIEKNLRPVLKMAVERFSGNVVLVYGDLCLGMNSEMKKLADEYCIAKIDALNCIDCQLGGKGKLTEADPHQDLMFLTPGMTDFFKHAKNEMHREGIDEAAFKQLFKGIRGIVLVDTLGNAAQLRAKVEELDTGLKILETRQVGCENVKKVIQEAIAKSGPRGT